MFNTDNTILIAIDFQEKLVRAMYQKEKLIENTQKLIKGLQVLEVPVISTEQNPQGLGVTIPEIASLFPEYRALPKFSFSCCSDRDIARDIGNSGRSQVLIAGIEAHVCVYQTAMDLMRLGYEVQIVSDCVSSRSPENINVAIERLRSEGAKITSLEMALFELLGKAEGPKFKEISKIVK
ncbi:MAG: hydrolase [Chloroflexi bacterium RBG_16_48_7]|nr:MAG: hydrolase [Chloroflexi bacterium RBG_16_48_7]